MPVRTKNAGQLALELGRTIERTGDVKSGRTLDRDILNLVTVINALLHIPRVQRCALGKGRQLGAGKDARLHPCLAFLPGGQILCLRLEPGKFRLGLGFLLRVTTTQLHRHVAEFLDLDILPPASRAFRPAFAAMDLNGDSALVAKQLRDLAFVVFGMLEGVSVEFADLHAVEPGRNPGGIADHADAGGVPFAELPRLHPGFARNGIALSLHRVRSRVGFISSNLPSAPTRFPLLVTEQNTPDHIGLN